MPKEKQNRKRKHETKLKENIEYEIDAPKTKFRPFDQEAQAEEEHLSQILFGGASNFLQCLEEVEHEAGPSNVDSGVGEDDSSNSDDQRKPAWTDEDDDGIEVGQALESQKRKLPPGGVNSRKNKYSNLLKHKYQSAFGTPKWATLNKKVIGDSDSEDEILQSCGFIAKATEKASISPTLIEFKKVKDLNCETYTEGPYVNSVEFHPTSTVALCAGNAGIVSIFAVDGKRNNKLHSVAFERYPILCAKFTRDGNEAILGSRHSFFYSYDLLSGKTNRIPLPPGLNQLKKFVISPDGEFIAVAGKWGEVHLISVSSKEHVGLLKQNSEVTALAYSPNGKALFGHSDTGEVTVWDANMRRIKHKFVDEGCVQGTALEISPSNQFLATGSAQGVVNVYGVEEVMQNKLPKPRKSILNLTTSIRDLKINNTSEIIALYSAHIQNAVKLFHISSSSVFSNFPGFSTNLGYINTANFSPESGYLALGNRKSVVSLYRLKHFKNY